MRITEAPIQSAELTQFLNTFMARSNLRIQEVEQQKDLLQVRTSIFTDLRGKLSKLERLADGLAQTGGLSHFRAKNALSSDDSVVSAVVTSQAVAVSHSIHVEQLARAHSVISGRYSEAGTEISSANTGTKNFTISVDGNDYNVAVDIQAGQTNDEVLDAVALAINSVSALPARATNVGDTDTTNKLSIISANVGTANKMTFTDTDGLLASLGVTNNAAATDTIGGYVYADLGSNELDAIFTLDGVRVVRSSNTLDDVMAGTTLQLHAQQQPSDADVNLDVSLDIDAVKAKVEEFLEAYNDVRSYLSGKVHVNPETFARGDLANNATYRGLLANLRGAVNGTVLSNNDPTMIALHQIGIRINSSGAATISDSAQFEEALADNLDAVEGLFSAADGIAVQLNAVVEPFIKGDGGHPSILANSRESIRRQTETLDNRIQRLEFLQELERERLIQQYGAIQEAQAATAGLFAMINAISASL